MFIFRKKLGCPLDRRPGGNQNHSKLFGGRIRRSVSPQAIQGAECTISALCYFYHTHLVKRTKGQSGCVTGEKILFGSVKD
jgi:hypothetical protein